MIQSSSAASGSRSGPATEVEIVSVLAGSLLAGRGTADLGQGLLAAVTVAIFWPVVPWWMGMGWLALFVGSSLARTAYRSRAAGRLDREKEGAELLALLRRDVWLSTLLWAGWALLMVGATPKDLALLLLVFAGLVAAGTSTLVADRPAFLGFMVFLLAPLVMALILSGWSRDHLSMMGVTALYAPFMVLVHKRAHERLVDQIRTSARLRISEEETARRRDFLNSLVTSAPSAIVVTDTEGRVVTANPALEEVMGFPAAEVLGRPLADLMVGSLDGDAFQEFFDTVRDGARRVEEVQLRHREGHQLWMRVSGTPADGAAAGNLIFVGEDVTEQVAAQEAREKARQEAEKMARAKSAFLASMSHEIRTPLNGILGMVEILLDSDLDREQREAAEVVRSSGQGLLRILNDVLDISKIEAGQIDLEHIDFNLATVLQESARVLTVQSATKGLELMVDVGPDVPRRVHGDPVRLRQILTNLLSNAVKFTREGEVVLSLTQVRSTSGGATLRFGVRDTGIGIAPDKQVSIFQEFEQADSSTTRTYGGTGLGLTICKRLVELMGGHIGVNSTPGEGSEFYFTLLLPDPVRDGEEPGRASGSRLDLGDLRFLVVDDNGTARRIVREGLSRAGAREVVETDSVDTGLQALRDARSAGAPFAAVIVDHMMPEKDGFDFARAVQADPEYGDVPLLMLTSAAGYSRAEVKEVGIGGYLSKPVARMDLLQALAELLQGERGESSRPLVTPTSLVQSRESVRILLAEDNPVNQQVAVALLRKRGYQVVAVADGAQAVEAAADGTFDIVLMDIQMPVMDGLEATRAILERCPELPVVALTAHAFAEERERTRNAGMVDFLAKPFQPDDLYELVDRWTHGGPGPDARVPSPTDETESVPQDIEPPVDLQAFRAVMRDAGVEEVVASTVQVYLEEAPTLMERLTSAVTRDDAEDVRAAAHSLKSSSGNIRARGLAALLQHLEDRAGEEDLATVEGVYPEVRAEYESVLAYLRAEQAGEKPAP